MTHERSFPSVIDSTMISALACHRRWVWGYELNFSSGYKSIDLMAGAAFAKGMECLRLAYLQGYYDQPAILAEPTGPGALGAVIAPARRILCRNKEDALEIGLANLMLAYDSDNYDADQVRSPKSLDRMLGAMEFYADKYPIDDPEVHGVIVDLSGKPGVEWNFCLPLPINHPDTGEPLLFAGRLDVILDIFGGRYLTDDKTTKSLGEKWGAQWDMRGQFIGYAWAARTLGIRVDGSLTRGVSILKTKFETQQIPVHQPDWKINEWLGSVVNKFQHAIILYRSRMEIPAFGEACNEYGGCEFKTPCMNKDHRGWLESNFTERNWNPLERH